MFKSPMEKLLKKLRKDPLFEEKREFGKMLNIHIDDLSDKERKRYDELKTILLEAEGVIEKEEK